MRSEASVIIDCPMDDVFRIATDQMKQWSDTVVEDEVIEEKPEGVGTTFRMITEDHGKRMEFQGVVTKYDAPRISAVHLTNNVLDIKTEFSFEELSGSTKVTQRAVVRGKGLYKPMMFIFGILMNKAGCKASENELYRLKSYCERQTVEA